MLISTKLRMLAAAAAITATAICSTHAQNFDTSGVKVDQALADRLPEKIKSSGVLTIGSDTTYAPWEFLSEKDGQTPEGIDVDIANAIGNRLAVKIDFQTSAFDAILPALGMKYDIGVSAFSITNERKKAVNFVKYTETGSLWAVKAGKPTNFDPTDICGRKIAIMSGTYHERAVTALNEECKTAGKAEAELVPFKTLPEALTRLAAGGAEATVSGEAGLGYCRLQNQGDRHAECRSRAPKHRRQLRCFGKQTSGLNLYTVGFERGFGRARYRSSSRMERNCQRSGSPQRSSRPRATRLS